MKNEISKPMTPAKLSEIPNPGALVRDPGDMFMIKVTKSGKKVAKLHAQGVKRSLVQHKNGGKIVETIAY